MAVFNRGNHDIKGCQFFLQLQPRFPASTRGIRRLRIFDHQTFVAASLSLIEKRVQFFRRVGLKNGSAEETCRWSFVVGRWQGRHTSSVVRCTLIAVGCWLSALRCSWELELSLGSRPFGSLAPCLHVSVVNSAAVRQQVVQNLRAFSQRKINEKFAIRIQNIECHIGDRKATYLFLTNFLASEALLQRSKREGAPAMCISFYGRGAPSLHFNFGRFVASKVAPRYNLAVENGVVRHACERVREFWERFRDFVAGARKESHGFAGAVRLRADAVIFVFDPGVLEVAERVFCGFSWAGQHETNGMKQTQPGLHEACLRRESQRLADIPQQHVGTLYRLQCDSCDFFLWLRRGESLGDRFFDQALFQSNPQVSSHDLGDVLGFERRNPAQELTD